MFEAVLTSCDNAIISSYLYCAEGGFDYRFLYGLELLVLLKCINVIQYADFQFGTAAYSMF